MIALLVRIFGKWLNVEYLHKMANYTSIADFNAAIANAKVLLPAMMMPLIKDAETVMCREIRARVSVTGETLLVGLFCFEGL